MFLDEYIFLKKLGEGAFATVWAARKRHGDDRRRLYAVKHLKQRDEPGSGKSLLTTPEFRSLKAIARHANILRAVLVARERGRIFLVTEWCDTNLLRLIEEARERGMRSLPESSIACAMKHVLEGIGHCHNAAWVHRDIKPENILVRDGVAKLADFGEAAEFNSEDARQTYCGTRWYRAPELLISGSRRDIYAGNGYQPSAATHPGAADLWAVGCVMAECYLGHAIFRGAADADMLKKIAETLGGCDAAGEEIEAVPPEMAHAWSNASADGTTPSGPGRLREMMNGAASGSGMDLLRRLLCIDPERRVTARQALRHPFFSGLDAAAKVALPHTSGARGLGLGVGGKFGRGGIVGVVGGGRNAVNNAFEFNMPKKAAQRAAMLQRRQMDNSDSSDDEFDFDAKPAPTAAPQAPAHFRGAMDGDVDQQDRANAGEHAVGSGGGGGDGVGAEIPQNPTMEAEVAMAEIRKQLEEEERNAAAGRGDGAGAHAHQQPLSGQRLGSRLEDRGEDGAKGGDVQPIASADSVNAGMSNLHLTVAAGPGQSRGNIGNDVTSIARTRSRLSQDSESSDDEFSAAPRRPTGATGIGVPIRPRASRRILAASRHDRGVSMGMYGDNGGGSLRTSPFESPSASPARVTSGLVEAAARYGPGVNNGSHRDVIAGASLLQGGDTNAASTAAQDDASAFTAVKRAGEPPTGEGYSSDEFEDDLPLP